ncbi:hypothetical protein H5410_017097 [Solanum commersonii]|uniref:Uncharacterized protein n=1 Tax=Solanum commersonii TaxID=4109 RepID=A0A9J5ZYC1_SOLCO|nr:hypothetical protein H5410_017097 [Solanum commersonii]
MKLKLVVSILSLANNLPQKDHPTKRLNITTSSTSKDKCSTKYMTISNVPQQRILGTLANTPFFMFQYERSLVDLMLHYGGKWITKPLLETNSSESGLRNFTCLRDTKELRHSNAY